MKKLFGFLSLLFVLTLTACGGLDFSGNKIGNDKEFLMDYDILNTTESQKLTATKENRIHAKIVVDDGHLTIKIQNEDKKNIYESENIFFNQDFDVEIKESGKYNVIVTGTKAKGSVKFTVENKE